MQCCIKNLDLRLQICCHFMYLYFQCCISLCKKGELLCFWDLFVDIHCGFSKTQCELSLLCLQTSARTQKPGPSTRLETPGRSTCMGSGTSATAMVVALESGIANLCRPTQVRNPAENDLTCWVRPEEGQLPTPHLFRFLYLLHFGFLLKQNRFSLSLGRHKQWWGVDKEGLRLFAAIPEARVSSENDPQCTQQLGFTLPLGI